MPIHFSVGFVIEESPRRAFVAECAYYVANVQASANYVNVVNVNAIWPREEKCK